jgi:hypothetical protein
MLLVSGFFADPLPAQVPEICAELDERSGETRLVPSSRDRVRGVLRSGQPRIHLHVPDGLARSVGRHSGTGKTMADQILRDGSGLELHRVDLSALVSEDIGETEKNLSRVFETAVAHRWVLFFDEADALFGRRTGVRDAHDRYANQEVSYLLQRGITEHRGPVMVAGSDAFARQFMPRPNLVIRAARRCPTDGR